MVSHRPLKRSNTTHQRRQRSGRSSAQASGTQVAMAFACRAAIGALSVVVGRPARSEAHRWCAATAASGKHVKVLLARLHLGPATRRTSRYLSFSTQDSAHLPQSALQLQASKAARAGRWHTWHPGTSDTAWRIRPCATPLAMSPHSYRTSKGHVSETAHTTPFCHATKLWGSRLPTDCGRKQRGGQ